MDTACHVIGCQLTHETVVHNAFGDVASTIHENLPPGVFRGAKGAAPHQEAVGKAVQVETSLIPC
jgi:hypothetical protein